MIYLRQSTAGQVRQLGPYLDPANFNTPKLALTINAADILIEKCGSAVQVPKNSGGATHVSGDTLGFYAATFDATDTDTCGSGKIQTHPTGANSVVHEFCVLPQNVYDSFVVGADQVTDASVAAAVVTAMDASSAKLAAIVASQTTMPADVGAVVIDGAVTRDQALTLLLAIFGGGADGLTGATKIFRNQAGDIILTATFSNSGNTRSIVLSF